MFVVEIIRLKGKQMNSHTISLSCNVSRIEFGLRMYSSTWCTLMVLSHRMYFITVHVYTIPTYSTFRSLTLLFLYDPLN